MRAGRIRAIASTDARRGSGTFADLPTVSETLPGFELGTWHALFVAAATPREIVQRLNREMNAVLSQPEIRQRLTESGYEVVGNSVEAFEEVIRRDSATWTKMVVDAGIKPE